MEMLSGDAEASAGSVKSEDSTPPHEGGRGSPPPNCAICLGTCRNKCFTDSCLHQFCFKCLLTWSKVKAECPLCKQNFKSIIHNVRSNEQYEEYVVEQRVEAGPDPAIDLSNATRRFRYRTTLTLPRRDSLAIQHLLMHYPMMAGVLPGAAPLPLPLPLPAPPPPRRRRRSPASFRRTVYRHNLWARPLPDFTGRFRDCSPEFYRRNDSQMHRLVPWLSRELHYLLNENAGHIAYVLSRLLELLPQHHVNSPEFAAAVQRYFGDRTEHFLHELHCFASTPYDMAGYDRQVQYTTDTRISTVVSEVLSSTDSESADSDIVMVSASAPAEAPAGPSRPRVVPIEAVSRSGSDDDEEVVVVGYIKPPADRTPEVVDLVGSDSDVVVQEPAPEPERAGLGLVKLSLTRRRAPGDSDGGGGSAPEPEPEPAPEPALEPEPERRPRRRRERASPPPASSGPEPSSSSSSSSSCSSAATDRRRRNLKRTRRRSARRNRDGERSPTQRDRDSERSPARRDRDSERSPARRDRDGERSPTRRRARRPERARKSHAGRGVKSSRRGAGAGPGPGAEPEPGPSGRGARLRSVVNVPAKSSDSSSSGNSNLLSILSSAILDPRSNVLAYSGAGAGDGPGAGAGAGAGAGRRAALLRKADSCFESDSGSDPEDDLPLNLSVRRSRPL